MNMRRSTAILSALAAILASACFAASAPGAGSTWSPPQKDAAGGAPPAAVPTFSTADIARQGYFYVGGHYVGEPGKEIMDGAMYVEVMVPKKIRHPYPIVFLYGGAGQSSVGLLQTPDGRAGWAYYFLRQGYTVYMLDYPTRGRSPYVPGVDGQLSPPRTSPLMEEVWSLGRPPSTPQSVWPQAKKYTQWPGDGPNKGKMGDPIFDAFARTELSAPTGQYVEKLSVDAIVQLTDLIGQPVILIIHSAGGSSGWLVADARPKLIKGIVAVEPVAPPIENAERGSSGPARLWGLTNLPITYNPTVKEPSELRPVRQDKPDGPDLIPCWVQQEPAHKLVNLQGIPVLDVTGEASYHRPYAHCIAKWLNQAGVKTTFVKLEDVGLTGNGHLMMLEKNSDGIAAYLESWIEKNVH